MRRVESSTHLPFIALCIRKYVFIYENFIFRSLQLLYDLNNFHIDTLIYQMCLNSLWQFYISAIILNLLYYRLVYYLYG